MSIMEWIVSVVRDFWRSGLNKAIILVGVLAAVVQLLDLALPELPQLIQFIARTSLIAVALYIIGYLLIAGIKSLQNQLIAQLSQQVSEQVTREVSSNLARTFDQATAAAFTDEHAYLYAAGRYGVSYNSLVIECVIHTDGSATLRREYEVEAHSEVDAIDAFLLVREKAPSGETRDIDLLEVKSLTPGREVNLAESKEDAGRLSAILAISPALHKGENVTYEMRERLQENLFAIDLSREELNKRENPWDYVNWNILRPTKQLSIRVFFPAHARPNVFSGEARYASASGFATKRLQHEEQARIERPKLKGPEGERYVLAFDIVYPMTGLIYELRWKPQEKAE